MGVRAAHTLRTDVDAFLTGRDPDGPTDSLDAPDNLAHHRPHVPAALAAARRHVAVATGTDVGRWVTMRQVHGAEVALVEGDVGREVRGVDALVTRERDLALVVMVADCVPVLLAGRETVAAVHAGWRGIVAGVVEAAVARMRAAGDGDDEIVGIVGPSIGGCCYEVGAEVQRAIAARVPTAVGRTTRGTPSVDLPHAVQTRLADLEVRTLPAAVPCTRCGSGWFSHRADPASGRQIGLVVRRPITDAS